MSKTFKPTAVVLFSGGVDSGVLTHVLLEQGETVLGVSAVYGSKHNKFERGAVDLLEQFFAEKTTGKYPGKFQTYRPDLESAFMHADGPMFTGGPPLPAAHYADQSQEATIVPGRNLILIALAASVAEAYGASAVYVGAHAGDYAIYFDCRTEFLSFAQLAVRCGSGDKVRSIHAPFLTHDKAGIVKLGISLGFPFQLARTCYSNRKVACGRCGSCQERLAAFRSVGQDDPLEYDTRDEIPTVSTGGGGNPV